MQNIWTHQNVTIMKLQVLGPHGFPLDFDTQINESWLLEPAWAWGFGSWPWHSAAPPWEHRAHCRPELELSIDRLGMHLTIWVNTLKNRYGLRLETVHTSTALWLVVFLTIVYIEIAQLYMGYQWISSMSQELSTTSRSESPVNSWPMVNLVIRGTQVEQKRRVKTMLEIVGCSRCSFSRRFGHLTPKQRPAPSLPNHGFRHRSNSWFPVPSLKATKPRIPLPHP